MSDVEKNHHPRIGGCCPICRLPLRECLCGEGRAIEIGDRDQAFERLERELAEEKRLHEKTQDELGRVLLELNEVEVQAAALRGVLHDAVPHFEKNCVCAVRFGGECWWCRAYAALSLDAGAKMLRVVEVAKEFLASAAEREANEVYRGISGYRGARMSDLREALAALDGG